ncbi:MAG: hypothetical protein HXS54_06235 [Theionarchaea archaeon]|nr:hypothetical protein [Theionarchaea archaeon]DBA34857.1 TPA_asm: hypothetical protein vir521_00063 [Caudoviricetes sp. vir521]
MTGYTQIRISLLSEYTILIDEIKKAMGFKNRDGTIAACLLYFASVHVDPEVFEEIKKKLPKSVQCELDEWDVYRKTEVKT